jgi:glutathione synthase/RimK-type ligase-like ATP-grasp enzyme
MKLYCFDDKQSSWGRMLFIAARQRGLDAVLFKHSRDIIEPGYVFFRLEQRHVDEQREQALIILDKPGIIGIQNREDILEYEDKVYQVSKYGHWFPTSWVVEDFKDVEDAIDGLGYPIVSKSRTGSGSAAVRLITTEMQATVESLAVFRRGLRTDRELQEGYLLWQKFLPGNEYSYRVVRISDWYFMLRVYNRDGVALASGSGKFEPVIPDTAEDIIVLNTAVKFFEWAKTKWCGVDMLYDRDANEWKIIETTLAWNLHSRGANVDCPFFDANGYLPSAAWTGAHQFEVLLRELETGAFDG